MAIATEITVAFAASATLGEGALWDAAREVVWFVDIKEHKLWRFDPATAEGSSYAAPGQIGWALPTEDAPLLCGLQDGLYLFDPDTQAFAFHIGVPGEPSGNRLNDACTDTQGRAWFGSMDDAEEAASGRFYVYDRGKVSAAGPAGIAITNGPAVSPDGRRIYFTDTLGQRILVAELLADGGVGEARLFTDTRGHFPDAFPDGPVVDAEGYLWTGLYKGGHVARYSPEGELVTTIKMPAENITKMCFGGAELRTAYVTSARKGLSEAELAAQPLAGSLLSFNAPVAGCAQTPVRL